MLTWIQDFLEWIVTIIQSLVNFLITMLGSTLDFFRLIPTVLAMFTTTIGFLPSVLVTFATIALTVSILYLVLGRSHD